MRKFVLSSPLGTLAIILSFFTITVLVTNACRKMDRPNDGPTVADLEFRFFNQHTSSTPEVQAITNLLKRENNKNPYVEKLAKKAGFPWWDKAIILAKNANSSQTRVTGEEDGSTVVFIPFAKDEQQVVSAALRVTITSRGDTLVKVLYASKYNDTAATGMSPRHLSLLLMKMDNAVFGHTLFQITDSAAMGGLGKRIEYVEVSPDTSVPISGKLVHYSISVCYTVTYPGYCDGQVHGVAPGENPYCTEYLCESVDWWEDDGSGGGGGGWPPGGGGGGGGGSTGGDPNPCRAMPGDPDPCAGGTGSGGWVPVDEPPPYNPYNARRVTLDTSITNNFPCVKKIMDSIALVFNVPVTAQLSLYNVFGIQKQLNLKYKINPNWTKDSLDGHTNIDPAFTHEDSDDFFATIELNPWLLSNATQEYIAATIIHEAVHAYISYKYWQYTHGIIDSTAFKTLFPLFWPPRVVGPSVNGYLYAQGNTPSHQAMAANLVDIMAAPLEFVNFNPYIPHSVRDSINKALTWGGLQETTVWSTKSDTCNVKAINTFARDTAVTAPFMMTAGACSTISNNDSRTLHMKRGCQ